MADSIPTPLIAARSITKSFSGVPALRDVDFSVAAGEIHALLGDDRYAYYANYERTLPWRARFLDLAKVLRSVDPLTDEQIDSLVTWTAEASPHLFTSHSKGDPRLPEGLLDRARSILSPLQQRKLQEAQAADAAQLALDRIAEATQ